MAVYSRFIVAALIVFSSLGFALAQSVGLSVWLIPIDAEITPGLAEFVKARVAQANEEQPLALVFEIDTPGGRIDAMEEIVNAILQDAQVPTIAVVRQAFSAGSLIAMSAEQVVMLPGSAIGAALPVTGVGVGPMSPADEKVNSAMRAKWRSVALARGRNAEVAEAMVNPRREIPGLATGEELVTLSASQAVEYDIADLEAPTLRDALEQLGYAGVSIERLEPTAAERAAGILTSPLVASALLAIGVIGIIIELLTPGIGIPGGIGLLALGLFFGGTFIATPAGIFEVFLLILALLLLAAEIFLIPGFGVAGILGIGMLIFAVFRIFQEATLPVLGYSALFAGGLLALALWLLPNTRLANPLILSTRLGSEPAGAGGEGERGSPSGDGSEPFADLQILVGQQGKATSDLRPAGVARFGPLRIDVVTEGGYIAAGTPVKVLRVEGRRVTVRAMESD